MRLTVRRIGNSLGVIVPKARLTSWGVSEGGELERTEHAIRPVSKQAGHEARDRPEFSIALEVGRHFSARPIPHSLPATPTRLRWRAPWAAPYDEWLAIAKSRSDGALFAARLGRVENADRRRRALPVGVVIVQAQLTENSWLLMPSVRLTGGFAFATWWKGPNAGQFVVTMGGYHPSFNHPGYPNVPRLGLRWPPTENISIIGESYFALCSEAILAGISI